MTTPTNDPPIVLVPMTETERLKVLGAEYPDTLDGWRWLYRCRHERGMADAFRRSGRRILVDVPRYLELVRSQPAA